MGEYKRSYSALHLHGTAANSVVWLNNVGESYMPSNEKRVRRSESSISPAGNADAILDAAEELFAQKGFSAVSMRTIAAESGQHLASANYYFGSKAGLFEQAFLRRIVPVNDRRLELLDQKTKKGKISLQDIVEAYISPLFESEDFGKPGAKARIIMLFSKQVLSNPDEHKYLQNYYESVARGFISAIQRSCEGISLADAIWGYNYMVGILVFTLAGKSPVAKLPDDFLASVDQQETDEVTVRRLKAFICAGLEALNTKAKP